MVEESGHEQKLSSRFSRKLRASATRAPRRDPDPRKLKYWHQNSSGVKIEMATSSNAVEQEGCVISPHRTPHQKQDISRDFLQAQMRSYLLSNQLANTSFLVDLPLGTPQSEFTFSQSILFGSATHAGRIVSTETPTEARSAFTFQMDLHPICRKLAECWRIYGGDAGPELEIRLARRTSGGIYISHAQLQVCESGDETKIFIQADEVKVPNIIEDPPKPTFAVVCTPRGSEQDTQSLAGFNRGATPYIVIVFGDSGTFYETADHEPLQRRERPHILEKGRESVAVFGICFEAVELFGISPNNAFCAGEFDVYGRPKGGRRDSNVCPSGAYIEEEHGELVRFWLRMAIGGKTLDENLG
ncbi:hypothetical protein B0H17DRAFT_1139183 [Mycena rosella]|uniref:Uncharacterized protein n=1 Tax=Mycena rosella TaxID=1033263 RepID=A0AAD7D4Q4_MYCRO|nr:hypothetical protein B0H17DRAFT_1139183 [Mycena rosella]